jgi:hypothetical protein
MELARQGNLIEASVWFVIALALGAYAFSRGKSFRPTLWLLAITMAIFGISDLVEARTGAWWRPWWLFVWKALCVIALLAGFLSYYRLTKRNRSDTDVTPPS